MISFPTIQTVPLSPPSTSTSTHLTQQQTSSSQGLNTSSVPHPQPYRPGSKRYQSYAPSVSLSPLSTSGQGEEETRIRPRLSSEGRGASYSPELKRRGKSALGMSEAAGIGRGVRNAPSHSYSQSQSQSQSKSQTQTQSKSQMMIQSPNELYAFPSYSSNGSGSAGRPYESIETRLNLPTSGSHSTFNNINNKRKEDLSVRTTYANTKEDSPNSSNASTPNPSTFSSIINHSPSSGLRPRSGSIPLALSSSRAHEREIAKGVRISTAVDPGKEGRMGRGMRGMGLGTGLGEGAKSRGEVERRGSEEEVLEVKVVLLGSQGVGKTTLARRYAEGTYGPSTTRATLSTSLFTRKLNWEGGEVRLQIWDTVGEERHRSLTKLYYRGAQAAIIVYDITSDTSFQDVQTWLSELRNMIDEVLIFIVGAKWDLTKEGKRTVDRKRARVTVARWLGLDVGDGGLDLDIERMNSPGPGSPIVPRNRQTSLFRSNTVGSPLDFKPEKTPFDRDNAAATTPVGRPGAYRFFSLLSSQPPTPTNEPVKPEAPDNANLAPGSRGVTGARSNSASAAALMSFTGSPPGIRTPLPTSGSTSGLNLMAATSVAPRRKSEDWSNSRARGEALRAIQGDLTAYASGDNSWKRRSGEILAGWEKAAKEQEREVENTKKVEDLFEDDPYWGKKIVGTNVRIGEVSSKMNKGIDQLFASMTAQLALRRRQINMERLRKQRESIYLNTADTTDNTKGKNGSKSGNLGGGCCGS